MGCGFIGKCFRYLLISFLLTNAGLVFATAPARLTIAVASNFLAPAQQLAKDFQQQTGITVLIAGGASGNLYTQIIHGAPFDLFFSADSKLPQQLVSKQLALADSLTSYAKGQLVLYSTKPNQPANLALLTHWQDKLVIANPKLAPYGQAAVATLKYYRCYQQLKAQLLMGNNVSQAFHYVDSGAASLGLLPLSLLKSAQQHIKSSSNEQTYQHYWLIPAQSYPPIIQQAVILKRTKALTIAKQFISFVMASNNQKVLVEYGYLAH